MLVNSHLDNAHRIAIIGFSEQDSPLEPLWPSTHRALMPVAGKPVIVHLVEQLADAGIRHFRIAGSIQQFAVRNRLRNGQEWGVTIRYSDLHKEELLHESVLTNGQALLVYGDHLYDADFAAGVRADCPIDTANGTSIVQAGYWQLNNGQLCLSALQGDGDGAAYENPLSTPTDYLNANRFVLEAARRLIVPGAPLHQAAIADWKSMVAPTALVGDRVFIGKHSRVNELARLEANCVLSNGVVIESGACLRNVIVLPNCFVGREMCICDAILGSSGVLGLDGQFIPVNNARFLSRTRPNAEVATGLPDALEELPYAETLTQETMGVVESNRSFGVCAVSNEDHRQS